MPFTKGHSDDLPELRDMAYGWGSVVARRAYGEQGPGLDLDFDSIESLAVDMGQAVIKGAIEEVLRAQLKLLGDHQPCPKWARACGVGRWGRRGLGTLSQLGDGLLARARPLGAGTVERHPGGDAIAGGPGGDQID